MSEQTNSGHVAVNLAEPDTSAHTATPWYVGRHAMGGEVALVVAAVDCIAITAYGEFASPEDDAKFIVRACNRDHAFDDLVGVANHPNWRDIWLLLNSYASGKTQEQFARVDANAVLGDVYFMLAQIDFDRKAALAKATK